MLDRRADRAARRGHSLSSFLEVRIRLVKLAHLAISSPTQVAVPGVSQVELRDLLEAPCRVEARSEFIGQRLIVEKTVGAGRTDGLFVKAHRLNLAAFNARDLGGYERRTTLEIFRAMRCPHL